jgi:hypothetical protein
MTRGVLAIHGCHVQWNLAHPGLRVSMHVQTLIQIRSHCDFYNLTKIETIQHPKYWNFIVGKYNAQTLVLPQVAIRGG